MTPKRHPLQHVQRFLVILCLALAGYTVYELGRPQRVLPLERDTEQAVRVVPALLPEPGGDLPPVTAFAEIVERPLFMENRRPYVAPAPAPVTVIEPEPPPAAPVEPDITEQVSLRATIIIGEKRMALIQELAMGEQRRLNRGEAYNGWTLTGVDTDSISMRKGEVVRQITLKKGQP